MEKLKPCQCGCGALTMYKFKRGHWQKTPRGKRQIRLGFPRQQSKKIATDPRQCACGCGRQIIPTAKHKYRQPRYLVGHSHRGKPNHYIPRPEEIPSGLCECGCGNRTGIARVTLRARRHFFGHPVPRLRGHGQRVRGSETWNWKGGRILNRGYVLLHMAGDPRSDIKGYYPEHRKVWEDAHGALAPNMHVHHINGIKDDNRLENLIALTIAEHMQEHAHEKLAKAREKYPDLSRRAGRAGAARRWAGHVKKVKH